MKTHYENLQITENASPEVIKGAYRYLSQKWHPDKNPDNRAEAERISRILNEAYSVLSDPIRRKEYADWIREQRQQATASQSRSDGSRPSDSTTAPVAPPPQGSSFLKRTWLMLLFVASLVILLGGFPYQVFAGDWQWKYVPGLGFWLWVGYYSYTSLFNLHVIAEEKRQEKERRLAIQPNTLKGLLVGAATGVAAFALFAVLLANDPKSQMSFDLFTFGFFVIAGAIIGALGLRR